jgi:hypothetical protein
MREAAYSRFERRVDPEGKLDPATRLKLAENAKKAFYSRIQYLSAQSRRRVRAEQAKKAENNE